MTERPLAPGLRLGAVVFTLAASAAALRGQPVFSENFDTTQPPILPAGWSTTAGDWILEGDPTLADTPPNAVHAPEAPVVSDKRLTSPMIAIPAGGPAQLTFRQRYSMPANIIPIVEAADDYGTLEIAIASGPFVDILSAGGQFLAGGYNETYAGSIPVWGGDTGGAYETVTASLPAAASGNVIQLRWHMVTTGFGDPAVYEGWRIDSIVLVDCPPTAVAKAGAPTICPGSSTTLTGSGGDTCLWSPSTWLSDAKSCTPTVVPAGATGTVDYTLTVVKFNCPVGSNIATATVSVTSQPTPVAVASASATTICPGTSAVLTGSAAGGETVTCRWVPTTGLSNPDGCTTTATPLYSATTYTLTVTNVCKAPSSNTAQVTIMWADQPQGPQVDVPAQAAVGDSLTASIHTPEDASYDFEFAPADGATVTGRTASSITFTVNSLPLTLSVTESIAGCVSKPSVYVIGPACTVPGTPTNPQIAAAGAAPGGPVTGIDYLDLSWTAPSPAPTMYLWALNGGPTQTTTATLIPGQPPTGNNDSITLKVRGACSESVYSDAASVTVSPVPPGPAFTVPSPVAAGTLVTVTDVSEPDATSWTWLFGDGPLNPETDLGQSAGHVYQTPGIYTIWLIASNGAGAASVSQQITVTSAGSSSTARMLLRRSFDASNPERQKLSAVDLSEAGERWLHVQSLMSRPAIVFLRFLDPSGALVLERRLWIAPGQDAAFDLKAYGLEGIYDLEVVATERVVASVTEPPSRVPRVLRRPSP